MSNHRDAAFIDAQHAFSAKDLFLDEEYVHDFFLTMQFLDPVAEMDRRAAYFRQRQRRRKNWLLDKRLKTLRETPPCPLPSATDLEDTPAL